VILYYTHRKFGESNIIDNCFVRLAKQAERVGQKLIVVIPTQNADNIPSGLRNLKILWFDKVGTGIADIFYRIQRGLEQATRFETVYLAEHDVLYPDEHFKHVSKRGAGYNLNYTYLSEYGYFQRHRGALSLSMLSGHANMIKEGCDFKLKELKDNVFNSYEPKKNMIKGNFKSVEPCVDIRHDFNCSWRVDIRQDKFWNNIPNTKIWKNADILWAEINKGDRLK